MTCPGTYRDLTVSVPWLNCEPTLTWLSLLWPGCERTVTWLWACRDLTVSLRWPDWVYFDLTEFTLTWLWAYRDLTVSVPWLHCERTVTYLWADCDLTVSIPCTDYTEYLCSVRVSKHTAIISLDRIDWFFWHVRKDWKNRLLGSSCQSVRPHGTTRLPLDGFSEIWYLSVGPLLPFEDITGILVSPG